MSGYYRDGSRGSRGSNPHDRNLPPIRELLRDELDRPVQPSPYSFREVQSALPIPGPPNHASPWEGYRGYPGRGEPKTHAPPLPSQHDGGYSSYAASDGRRHSSQGPAQISAQHSGRSGRDYNYGTKEPGYSYGVLRTSGTSGGGLTDATPPSDRPQGILRQTAAPAREDPEDLSKRHKCEYCGKRFGMPSHLQIHIRTHTAQKPFACEWPGCDRAFSVRSNMMRHYRSHDKATGSRQQAKDYSKYDYGDEGIMGDRTEATTSNYVHAAPSSGHGSSFQYYSSPRRK